MHKSELTRRKVLTALATAGSTGVVLGSGTGARFVDTEETTGNTVAAGAVDLAVDWSLEEGGSGSSTGGVALPITLTDETREATANLSVTLPGAENNPVYPWLRVDCPVARKLADELQVTISYRSGEIISEGSLVSVATDLRNGRPLDPDGDDVAAGQRDCLAPEDTVELVVTATLPESYAGRESLSLNLAFHARQCRHNDGQTSPYPSRPECPEPPEVSARHAISFIAFCASENPDPELVSVNSTNGDGEPLSVDWETDTDVRAVVVKAGPYLTVYDYSDETATSGTATPNDDEAAAYLSTDDDAYDRGDESIPCTVAQRVIDGDTDATFEGTQVKFEYEEKS